MVAVFTERIAMKIKDLPDMERPYEKLESFGAENLSNAELIAIILKSGTRNVTSIELAQRVLLLDKENVGLAFLKDFALEDFQKISGLGRIKAIQLKALGELLSRVRLPHTRKELVISSPEAAANFFTGDLGLETQEYIKTMILNSQNKLIRIETNALGSTNASYVELKNIFREPIKSGAAKIIVVHNHPGGDPAPSKSDIAFTVKLKDVGMLLGIEVLDHIIIANDKFVSLKRLKKF